VTKPIRFVVAVALLAIIWRASLLIGCYVAVPAANALGTAVCAVFGCEVRPVGCEL
jgi:hypothetical protein